MNLISKTLLPTAAAMLLAVNARADAIPYPTPGAYNPITYTFTATASGNITAYFVGGAAASYNNELTMLVNGNATGIVGLGNHSSALGQSLNLGSVAAGDSIVFVLVNHTLGADAYSDPSLNGSYDSPGSLIHNHIYSTAYTQTPPIDSIPNGTFVAFEDLRFPSSDFNYNDETFVFSNVSVVASPDTASTLILLGLGCLAIAFGRRFIPARATA